MSVELIVLLGLLIAVASAAMAGLLMTVWEDLPEMLVHGGREMAKRGRHQPLQG